MKSDFANHARKTFEDILKLLDLPAKITVADGENTDRIRLQVNAEAPGRIIGRNGKTLRAIELLLNTILQRRDEDTPRISIDVERMDGKKRPDKRADSPRPPRKQKSSDCGHSSRHGAPRGDSVASAPTKKPASPAPERAVQPVVAQAPAPASAPAQTPDKPKPAPTEKPPQQARAQQENANSPNRPSKPKRERRAPAPVASNRENRREDSLDQAQKQARDAIKEVKRWGEPVTLPPMNESMRQQISAILVEHAEIETITLGNGNSDRKRIKIQLKSS